MTLFYDILVTLDQEINNVWSRKLSVAGILFLLNRYLNVGVVIANLLSFFPIVQTSLVSGTILAHSLLWPETHNNRDSKLHICLPR